MFTADLYIDGVQTAKKQFVKTVFAKNETVAEILTDWIEAQTAYTKEAVKAQTSLMTKLGEETVKATKEMAKFDFSKAMDQVTKQFAVKK